MDDHKLDHCISVLNRWSAHSDSPLPTNWGHYEAQFAMDAMALRDADPELVALLSNTATAKVKADALSGALSPVAPDREQERKNAKGREIQRLYDLVKVAGVGGDITSEMQLASIAPEVLEKLKTDLQKPVVDDYASAQARRAQKEQADAITHSKNHGNAIAGATPWVATRVNRQLNSN